MKRLWISAGVLLTLVCLMGWLAAPASAGMGQAERVEPSTPIVLPTNTVPPERQSWPGQSGPPPAVETPSPELPVIPLPARPATSPQGPLPPGAAPVRIRFAPGTISAVRSDRLAARSSDVYVLAARAGQTLEAWLDPANDGATLTVWGPKGIRFVPGTKQNSHWLTRLPTTGDYFISVSSRSKAAVYKLTILVETLGARPATRISFPPGGTSATISGSLRTGVPARYVLRAASGQSLEVTPLYSTPPLAYAIYGADGVILRSFGEKWGPWRGVLPSGQDYYVEVVSPAGSNSYRMAVSIPPLRR
jgi:hypothetical protein